MKIIIGLILASILMFANIGSLASPHLTLEEVEQRECMLEAILFEAGNQSTLGKLAVAIVILNRTKHESYPDTVCEVVHQGPINTWWYEAHDRIVPIKHKCQFSYWCDGKAEDIMDFDGTKTYDESLLVVNYVFYTSPIHLPALLEGATHYHADYVKPKWASVLKKVATIDNHIFYK